MHRSSFQWADAAAGTVGRALVRWGGVAAVVLGALTLVGWRLPLSVLVQLRPSWPVTSAATGLALVVAGTGVELLRRGHPTWQPVRRVLGGGLALGGTLAIAIRTGWVPGIEAWTRLEGWQPGQATETLPANATGLVVVAIGLALALGDAPRWHLRLVSHVTTVLSWIVLGVVLLHYLGAETGGLPWRTPPQTSLPAAIGLSLAWIPLSAGTLARDLSDRVGRSVTTRLLVKRVLPLLVLIPPLVRAIGRAAEALGAEPSTAAALADISVIALVGAALFAAGHTIDGLQAERNRSKDLLAGVVGALHEGLVVRDATGHVIVANPAADELLGVPMATDPTPEELIAATDMRDEGGMPLEVDDLPSNQVRRTGRAVVGRIISLDHDPHERVWIRQTCVPFTDADGAIGTITTVADVTFDHEMSLALSLAEERFRLAFEYAPVGMAIVRTDGRFVDANPALCALMSRSREEVLRTRFQDIADPDELQADLAAFAELVTGERDSYRADKRYLLVDDDEVWVGLHVTALRDATGQVDRFLAQVVDLSDRKAFEHQLAHAATHDPLTGLPNRRLVEDRLEVALATARRDGTRVAVLFGDLDGFKTINDTYGHATGDAVLTVVAARLRSVGRDHDTVGRLGGDEFVVVAGGITDPADAHRIADRVRAAVETPLEVDEITVTPRISVGCHLADGDVTASEALTVADTQMYARKAERRTRTEPSPSPSRT